MTITELIRNNIHLPTQTYGDILLNERGNSDISRALTQDEREQYEMIKKADETRLYMNENMIEMSQKETPTERRNKRLSSNKPQIMNVPGIGEAIQIM